MPLASDSHLARIRRWWRTLGGERFVVLPPPTRSRFTQSDAHSDARVLLAERGLGPETSYAYWHWQTQERISPDGMLEEPLLLHWSGDHDVVREGLGAGPEGFAITDRGPQGAFELDLVTATDADGLPDPSDPVAVRKFCAELEEPISRMTAEREYVPLSAAQERWLRDRLAELGVGGGEGEDAAPHSAAEEPRALLEAAAGPLRALALRDAVTAQEAADLVGPWEAVHGAELRGWTGAVALLRSLLRTGHPRALELARAVGEPAVWPLTEQPSAERLALVKDLVLAGADPEAWLTHHARLHRVSPAQAASEVGAQVADQDVRVWDGLLLGLLRLQDRGFDAAARVHVALDEHLPRPLRAAAARSAERGLEDAELTAADRERFAAARPALLAGTGPDLTQYEGGLTREFGRYRVLSAADEAWLHERVADPATGMQGLGFCLELLYAHGAGTTADLDALRTRWRRVLTKKYETTYTEWRHPLVTLTCLAHDLGDPLAEQLDAWWAKQPPLWKEPARLLTLLGGEPTMEKVRELSEFLGAGGHDQGHLLTLVLILAKLAGERPVDLADALLEEDMFRLHLLQKALIGCVDPDQPLWHFTVDEHSRAWWDRIVEVVEDEELSAAARNLALHHARAHRVIRYPADVRGFTTSEKEAAAQWLARQPETF